MINEKLCNDNTWIKFCDEDTVWNQVNHSLTLKLSLLPQHKHLAQSCSVYLPFTVFLNTLANQMSETDTEVTAMTHSPSHHKNPDYHE